MSEVQDELAIEVEKAIALENGVINWDYWLELMQCELWYLIALSCGFDPFRLEFIDTPIHHRLTPTYYKPSDPAHIFDTITTPNNMVPNHIRFIGIPKNKEKMFGIRMEVALQDLEALLPPPIPDKVYYQHRQKFDVRKFVKWIKTKRTWAVPTELLNILKKNTKVNATNYIISDDIMKLALIKHGKQMADKSHKKDNEIKQEVIKYYLGNKDTVENKDKFDTKEHAAEYMATIFPRAYITILKWLYKLDTKKTNNHR